MKKPNATLSKARAVRLDEAQDALRQLGFTGRQTNEVAAYTLLACLDLQASEPWSSARLPLLGITPCIDRMSACSGCDQRVALADQDRAGLHPVGARLPDPSSGGCFGPCVGFSAFKTATACPAGRFGSRFYTGWPGAAQQSECRPLPSRRVLSWDVKMRIYFASPHCLASP